MSRNSPEKPQNPSSLADRRTKRLAEALRENLKRRKASGRVEATNNAGKSDPVED